VLRSLGHLTALPERPPIVVIDNGSTDGTAEAIARRFPQVEVVPVGRNLGAAGRTLGGRRVETPYVAFSGDDNCGEPGGLRLPSPPGRGTPPGRCCVAPADGPAPACTELARSPIPQQPGMPGPALLGFLAGVSVVRRSAFLEAGGFQSSLFIGGEEELLAVDLATRGWWLCYVPDIVVHHYPSPQR